MAAVAGSVALLVLLDSVSTIDLGIGLIALSVVTAGWLVSAAVRDRAFSEAQARTGGRIDELIRRAVGGLVSGNPVEQAGAIALLRTLGTESPSLRDYARTVLQTFVRQYARSEYQYRDAVRTAVVVLGQLQEGDPPTAPVRLDFSELDLSGMELSYVNWPSADLTHTELSGSTMIGARLPRAILAGAKLRRANLTAASLEGANLSGALLEDALLAEADLAGASLVDTVLTGADLSRADLSDAIVNGTDLRGALLEDARLPDGTPREGEP